MDTFTQPISERLRQAALALPETSEGTSCVNRAFKVRKKNFFFLGEKPDSVRVMLKLKGSLEEAAALDDPRISVGSIGWLTVNFANQDVPDADMLVRWIEESFRALAPKTVVRALDAQQG